MLCAYMCMHTYSPVVKLAALRMYCFLVIDRYYKNLHIEHVHYGFSIFKFCLCLGLLKEKH